MQDVGGQLQRPPTRSHQTSINVTSRKEKKKERSDRSERKDKNRNQTCPGKLY